jgi:CheY-like chemotaxis protein
MIRDLGTQHRLERRLQDVENATGLARIMPQLFNDIANRLTPILLQKGMLMEEATDPVQAGRIGKLLQSVEYAQILMRPLLMVLYPAAPHPELCSLNTLVQETVKRVEGEAAASGVAMDLTLDPNLQPCGLDPGMLREGLVCLLRGNLRQSVDSAARRVRIGTRQTGQTLQLVCQNTGRALPEGEARRIFELANAKDVESLGLSVIACVVKAHGGRISVRSQEGLGNAFLVELPMAEVPAPPPATGLQGQRILVVDDESFLLECLTDALGSWGCRPTPCAQATDAIEKLQAGTFDLIVSDIRMPGLTGIQLFEWILSEQPRMANRVLFTTGDSFDPGTRSFLERASVPHLGKPFDLKKLKQTLEDLLAAAASP